MWEKKEKELKKTYPAKKKRGSKKSENLSVPDQR